MLKKIALIIYGLFYILDASFAIYIEFYQGTFSALVLVRIIFSIWIFIGFAGYVFQKPFQKPSVWRRLFYLQCVSFSALLLLAIISLNAFSILDVVFTLIFLLPMLICLYEYSKPKGDVWTSESEKLQFIHLAKVLDNGEELSASKSIGERNITVIIGKVDGAYRVKVDRQSDYVESFKKDFSTVPKAVYFMEQYASFDMDELLASNT